MTGAAGSSARLTLVLLAGLPGAGKTSLALALGAALRWPVLDKDTLKSTLLDLGAAESLAAPASYELLMALTRDLLVTQRLPVILDSPTSYARTVAVATSLAREAGATLKVILCLARQEVRNARITSRAARRSQPVTASTVAGDGRAAFPHLPATTLALPDDRPLPELVAEALAYLGS